MSTNPACADRFNTRDATGLALWNAILSLQTSLFMPNEIGFLLSLPEWKNAKNILDVGCGNGCYTAKMSQFFNDKKFTGIDSSPELINLARKQDSDADFELSNFFDYYPDTKYDVILMRLVIQHMGDIDGILRHLSRLLNRDGRVIIIEPATEKTFHHPPTHYFFDLIHVYEQSTKGITNRYALSELAQWINHNPMWQVTGDTTLISSQTGPFRDKDQKKLYNYWIDYFEQLGKVEYPYALVREEIDQWCSLDHTYSQMGIRCIQARCNFSNVG